MPYTYILYSPSLDRFYIGHTDGELEDRLRRHLSDHRGFTARAKDWSVVWHRLFSDKNHAYAEERRLKARKSRSYLQDLINRGSL